MKILVIIDPQNDFIEGGSLEVPGGKEALEKIIPLLDESWDRVIVSLDTHHPSNLGFREPESELLRHIYRGKKVDKWPSHCLKDTRGWEIYKPLWEKLKEKEVEYVLKGEDDCVDCYGMPADIFKTLEEPEVEIYFTGLAEDFCVCESIKNVLEIAKDTWRIVLLREMTAGIGTRKEIDNKYRGLWIDML